MAKALYFSYDGLLDPLGQSQIVPYVSAISAAGHSLTIVSYEKVERTREQIKFMEIKLQNINVNWVRLEFRSGKFWAIKRLISGVLMIRKLCRDLQPDFLHLRGFVPSVIFQLSRSRVPFLYDFRGFALGEWGDMGKITQTSLLYRILNHLDRKAVKSASGFVVLEKTAKRLLYETYDVPNVPLKVIPTCTDVKRYTNRKNVHNMKSRAVRLVFLGGVRFPYRPDLALILIEKLIENGVDCNIDFINEGDHDIIEKAINMTSISKEKVRILGYEHSEIPDILSTYDCGIVMIEPSYWRRVCSPTKMGEYLASGLPVISLEGIDAIDQLAERTECVLTVSYEELLGHFKDVRVKQILSLIRSTGITHKCQSLAKAEFDLEIAGNLYVELYSEIDAQIRQMKCLYITYDGLLDPLGQSQILPYIQSLVSRGHTFTIISFEKQDRSAETIIALDNFLINNGIRWERLTFKKGNIQFVSRAIRGVFAIWKNSLRYKYDVVHLRGFMPAAIYKVSLLRTPFIYDIRAFIGEWVDIGKIKERTWLGRALIGLDRRSVEDASGLVVLDKSGELLLKEIYNIPSVPLKVIRTSTDISLYSSKDKKASTQNNGIFKFVFLGGALIPYRPDLALRFVSELIKHGLNCHIDFINERDHEQIYLAAKEVNFPTDKINVYKLDKISIPSALLQFDCGLIFNNTSRWRRVSSPTKFGEYLAAGLHTVALNGISVLEEFSESTRCVDLVSEHDLYVGLPKDKLDRIVENIRTPNRRDNCQELARLEFSLEMAGNIYADLYSEIEVQIRQ